MKNTKELENIKKAIHNWLKKHKGNVQFVVSFMAFKEADAEIYDDFIGVYGVKEIVKMDLEETTKMVDEEKEEFINW